MPNDLLLKLARLAFDKAAEPGEASAAAIKMVECARRSGMDFTGVTLVLSGVSRKGWDRPPPPAPPYCGDVVFQFGKHKGSTIQLVYLEDPEYLDWCAKKFDPSRSITKAINKFLQIQADND